MGRSMRKNTKRKNTKRKNLSKMNRRKNLSKMNRRKNLSKMNRRKKLSKMNRRKNLSKRNQRKNLSKRNQRKNLSKMNKRKNRLYGGVDTDRVVATAESTQKSVREVVKKNLREAKDVPRVGSGAFLNSLDSTFGVPSSSRRSSVDDKWERFKNIQISGFMKILLDERMMKKIIIDLRSRIDHVMEYWVKEGIELSGGLTKKQDSIMRDVIYELKTTKFDTSYGNDKQNIEKVKGIVKPKLRTPHGTLSVKYNLVKMIGCLVDVVEDYQKLNECELTFAKNPEIARNMLAVLLRKIRYSYNVYVDGQWKVKDMINGIIKAAAETADYYNEEAEWLESLGQIGTDEDVKDSIDVAAEAAAAEVASEADATGESGSPVEVMPPSMGVMPPSTGEYLLPSPDAEAADAGESGSPVEVMPLDAGEPGSPVMEPLGSPAVLTDEDLSGEGGMDALGEGGMDAPPMIDTPSVGKSDSWFVQFPGQFEDAEEIRLPGEGS